MEPDLPMESDSRKEIELNSSSPPSPLEHSHFTAMELNWPLLPPALPPAPAPSPPKHGHFAAHDRVEFELWTRAKSLTLAEFSDKLDEYKCPNEDSQPPGYNLPNSEQACCDFLNTLIAECM